ncbi:MAG TPA: hypothetical protein VIU14_13955 [Mesorhizobium sp.]
MLKSGGDDFHSHPVRSLEARRQFLKTIRPAGDNDKIVSALGQSFRVQSPDSGRGAGDDRGS